MQTTKNVDGSGLFNSLFLILNKRYFILYIFSRWILLWILPVIDKKGVWAAGKKDNLSWHRERPFCVFVCVVITIVVLRQLNFHEQKAIEKNTIFGTALNLNLSHSLAGVCFGAFTKLFFSLRHHFRSLINLISV